MSLDQNTPQLVWSTEHDLYATNDVLTLPSSNGSLNGAVAFAVKNFNVLQIEDSLTKAFAYACEQKHFDPIDIPSELMDYMVALVLEQGEKGMFVDCTIGEDITIAFLTEQQYISFK